MVQRGGGDKGVRRGKVFSYSFHHAVYDVIAGRGAFFVISYCPCFAHRPGVRSAESGIVGILSRIVLYCQPTALRCSGGIISSLRTDISFTSAGRQPGSEIKDREEDVSLTPLISSKLLKKYHLALDDLGNPARGQYPRKQGKSPFQLRRQAAFSIGQGRSPTLGAI